MNQEATKELLFKMADDELIIGHRNSEWTGIGPTIEEDIAFSSMAQDKIGHAAAIYTLLEEQFGEADPDSLIFNRKTIEFKCSQFVQLPIGGYEFSLLRHFLFDHAEMLRYTALQNSNFTPLAQLAKKIVSELKYHVLHADTWLVQLGNATEEARIRLQTALDEALPYSLGLFEKGNFEAVLIADGTFIGEGTLLDQWWSKVNPILRKANLQVPDIQAIKAVLGGRHGRHTEHLQPLLEEMTEVFRIDENAEW